MNIYLFFCGGERVEFSRFLGCWKGGHRKGEVEDTEEGMTNVQVPDEALGPE